MLAMSEGDPPLSLFLSLSLMEETSSIILEDQKNITYNYTIMKYWATLLHWATRLIDLKGLKHRFLGWKVQSKNTI